MAVTVNAGALRSPVADQDHPGLRALDFRQQNMHLPSRQQAGFIDDENRLVVKKTLAFSEAIDPRRGSPRFDVQVLPERTGDTPCGRRADNAVPARLPGVDDRRERRGLARARSPFDDDDGVRSGCGFGGEGLFGAQAVCGASRLDVGGIDPGPVLLGQP